jgi:hypothetical protein
VTRGQLRELFSRNNVKAMGFLVGMYGIWNLWAGTNGFFFPFILHTGSTSARCWLRRSWCRSSAWGCWPSST